MNLENRNTRVGISIAIGLIFFGVIVHFSSPLQIMLTTVASILAVRKAKIELAKSKNQLQPKQPGEKT